MSVLRKVMREPLVHFALIGAVLFTIDAWTRSGEASERDETSRAPPAPAAPIVVDADLRDTLADRWRGTHDGPPSPEALDALVERWIDKEVLYREGLARGLHRGDPTIRERVASRMAFILESRITVPEPDESELRAWHAAHPDRWSEAERIDFVQVFVEGHDESAQAEARRLISLLEEGASPDGLGDTFPGGRRYRGRRILDLAERFGEEFIAGLADQPEGAWAIRSSRFGLHLVRVEARTAARTPGFESVLPAVREDWRRERRAGAMKEALSELRSDWEIVVLE